MMKGLKLWQKAGLVTAIVTGLTLGGLTPKYDSKGLESKLPTVGMSVAEAKETNQKGYQVPDLTGYTKIKEGHLDLNETNDCVKETFVEIFKGSKGFIMKYTTNGRTWAYGKIANPRDKINDYVIRDSNCDGIFDEKYNAHTEPFCLPSCLE